MTFLQQIAARQFSTKQVSGDGSFAHVLEYANHAPTVVLFSEQQNAKDAARSRGGRVERLNMRFAPKLPRCMTHDED